ncbi:MAG: hypothetical protein KAS49_08725 [Candidatus Cloacimonetes bacterium]|nr:hypothetical protein [Candidatus Cloacimonadota bacterium]
MKGKILIVTFILIFGNLYCQIDSLLVKSLNNNVLSLEQKVSQVISNQINYKIEKDLLKETYSNNYGRIQLIISIVLGLITLFGIFGISSINRIKKDYEKELKEFRELKTKFENDYNKLNENQEAIDKQISELNIVNQEQDVKLKILEIKEKAGDFISIRNYIYALEYVNIGLNLEKDNISLLDIKALIYTRMQEYDKAVDTQKEILCIESDNVSAIQELAELYLLTNRQEDFSEFRNQNKNILAINSNNILSILLEVLYQYNQKDIEEIDKYTNQILQGLDENERKKVCDWEFSDIRNAIKNDQNSELRKHLECFIKIVSGQMSKKEYQLQLEKGKV